MAKETKSIQVVPGREDATIEVWEKFGWEMVGAPQEIKTQDVQIFTKQDSDGTKHYETKRGEHYIKITFQRDKAMPHYEELAALERDYYSEPTAPVEPVEPPHTPPKRVSIPFLVLAVIGLVIGIGVQFFLFVGGVFALLFILRFVRIGSITAKYEQEYKTKMEVYKKEKEEYPAKKEQYKEAMKRKMEASSRAEDLLK